MGLFNRKEGGLMDVIRCDEQEYLVWKWRPASQAVNTTSKENAIRYGSTLRVKSGEMAVFVYNKNGEQVMDFITGPYDDTIKTANFPVLTSIVGVAFGGNSPFPAEIYFVNLAGNLQVKFGVPYFEVADPRFLDFTVPVAVRGQLTINLTDVKEFFKLNRMIDFSIDQFREQIKSALSKAIKKVVTNCPADNQIPVLQIERKIDDINDLVLAKVKPELEADFGVNVKRVDIASIEIDKESENYSQLLRLTKEQQMRRAEIETKGMELSVEQQNLQAHAINKQTEVLGNAAQSLGQMQGGLGGDMNPASMMMGMGVAAGMGQQMANMMGGMNQMSQQSQSSQMTPPPIPSAANYMLAVNGQQYGPYNMQQMQQMATAGQLTAQSLVWCQGMATWETAGSRSDLVSLFTPVVPPLPQGRK